MLKNNFFQTILITLLVGAAFAIGSMWTELKILKSGGKTGATASSAPEAAAPEAPTVLSDALWQEIIANPTAIRGNADAKVTLVEFTDYQCPFCGRHFNQTEAKLKQEYVDTGKVRHIVRDLPLSFHANAQKAAEAARCAGAQEKYFEFHDQLFSKQDEWSELNSAAAATKFGSYAANLGLNTVTFNNCLQSGEFKAAVDADAALAQKANFNGTPSFAINGKTIIGAYPYESFKTMIDEALK